MDSALVGALIGAAVAGIIGIWQVILTRKALENTNRPYITIYNEVLNISKPLEYIVIKNSGNTPAKIENIVYDESKLHLMSCEVIDENGKSATLSANKTINYFKGSTIAPNQSYRIPINNVETKFDEIQFDITYVAINDKKYKDTYSLNLRQNSEFYFTKSNGETAISDTLQEILKKMWYKKH